MAFINGQTVYRRDPQTGLASEGTVTAAFGSGYRVAWSNGTKTMIAPEEEGSGVFGTIEDLLTFLRDAGEIIEDVTEFLSGIKDVAESVWGFLDGLFGGGDDEGEGGEQDEPVEGD